MLGRRVLLIDDEPPVLLTYTLILQRHGYEVISAATPAEARDALATHEFDTIICDLSIEGESGGFQILEKARQQNPSVNAILLTGYASDEQGEQAEAQGFQLLFKPIGVDDLVRAVGREASGGRQRTA